MVHQKCLVWVKMISKYTLGKIYFNLTLMLNCAPIWIQFCNSQTNQTLNEWPSNEQSQTGFIHWLVYEMRHFKIFSIQTPILHTKPTLATIFDFKIAGGNQTRRRTINRIIKYCGNVFKVNDFKIWTNHKVYTQSVIINFGFTPKTKGACVARWLRLLTSDLKLKMTDAIRY